MTDWAQLVASADAIVRRRAGLTRAGGRDVSVALKRVMTASQRANPAAYLRVLDRDAAAFDALIGELTVGETFFLRETGQLDYLRREVIPYLGRRRHGVIHAWSAGCASGEEAYTLSMLFHEAGLGERTRVLGTDISRERLRRARQGRYRPWSFRGVSEAVQRQYFRARGGSFDVVPELRASVEFRHLNLLDDDYRRLGIMPGGMDLILCRNVLIYLDSECVAYVARRLFESLSVDGWLLLAAADPRLDDLADFESMVTGSGVIYRKAKAPSKRASAHPAARPLGAAAEAGPPSPAGERFPAGERSPAASVPRASRRVGTDETPVTTAAPAPAAALLEVERSVALVRELADRGALEQAGRECASAMERYPESAELGYLESVLLFESGNFAAAAVAARRALYLNPRLAVAHLALGSAQARLGRSDAARRSFGTAERLLADLPPAAVVAAAGGATAAGMAEVARVQLRLLQEKVS